MTLSSRGAHGSQGARRGWPAPRPGRPAAPDAGVGRCRAAGLGDAAVGAVAEGPA